MRWRFAVGAMVAFLVGCSFGTHALLSQQRTPGRIEPPPKAAAAPFSEHAPVSTVPVWIQSSCSIVTFVLAVVVFCESRKHEKESKRLIDELRIAVVMGATVTKDAHVAKKIYDEYKKEFQTRQTHQGPS